MGASFNGRTVVSKTTNVGPIPTAPAFASLELGFGVVQPAEDERKRARLIPERTFGVAKPAKKNQ